jgi:radical SAM protein with 4Fe4S-binding SPASM domain
MLTQYLNAIYSVFSYTVKRYAGISINPPLPAAISVELSSLCNLACPECVTGAGLLKRKNKFIDILLAEKISEELGRYTISAWLYSQGEPMLHPLFFDIAKLFRNMRPVISTNGHFLNEENCHLLAVSGLKKIIIPYDGVTPHTYNIYRIGGDHARVTRGIRTLAEIIKKDRSRLRIELQFLLHRHNEHEVSEATAFARSVNAGFRIKSMQVLDPERAEEWMPSDSRMARYTSSQGEWKAAGSPPAGCMRMWTTAVITVDGDVVPCCFDKYAQHVMGNINDQTFSAIWYSDKYKTFRTAVVRDRSSVDICTRCPQGRSLFLNNL